MVDSNNDDGTSKPNGSTPATTSSSDLGMIDEEQQVQAQMIDEECIVFITINTDKS